MSNPDVVGVIGAAFMVAMVLIRLLALIQDRSRREHSTHRRKLAVMVAVLCIGITAYVLPKSNAAALLGLSVLPVYFGVLMMVSWGLWKTWSDN